MIEPIAGIADLAHLIPIGRFAFDDICTSITEHSGGDRSGRRCRKVEYAYTVKWAGYLASSGKVGFQQLQLRCFQQMATDLDRFLHHVFGDVGFEAGARKGAKVINFHLDRKSVNHW